MESMRDINRVMAREVTKGSCPLTFEKIKFIDQPIHFIESEEKLQEVLAYLLRIGEYRQFSEKTVINNIYMDLDILAKNFHFRRTRSVLERKEVYNRILRYIRKLKPDYEEKACIETTSCLLSLPENDLNKYRIQTDSGETYGFVMSNKYILGLFTLCENARRTVAQDKEAYFHLSAQEQSIVSLDQVRDVGFQALLLDNVTFEEGKIKAELCTIYLLKGN